MSKSVDNLLDYKFNKYSGLGVDGIVEYIFNIIGVKKGLFVEFGAWDGVYGSNCKKLFEEGWGGIFIECDKKKYKDLKKNYKKYKNIICLNKMIEIEGSNLFDNIVSSYIGNKDIDFCSIDIDGLDVEVFETFDSFMPTVVCIESGFMLPPFFERVDKNISSKKAQQSLSVTIDVFESKGYKILCAGCNCFFVKEEYYYLFNVPTDLLTLYFDGLRAFAGKIPAIWKKLKHIDGFKKYRNQIALDIMDKAGYNLSKDTPRRRKKWAEKKKDVIRKVINEIEIETRSQNEKS